MTDPIEPTLSRRGLLGAGLALGAGVAFEPVLRRLPAVASGGQPTARHRPGRLSDVDHVVIMIQENRSFDHYFGTLRGVRGFADRKRHAVFAQPDGHGGHVFPFHIDTGATGGGCTADPDHLWDAQHLSIADGRMDGWVTSRLGFNGRDAPVTMGYFDERDIPYYYALAKSFTICDRYFCSALGPTDPNRSYAIAGTMDPDGKAGGPVFDAGAPNRPPTLSFTTMPEQLEARGVSWKVYSAPDATFADGDNTLLFFTQYHTNPTLKAKGIDPTFDDFATDAAAGNLPEVSWLISPVGQLEHPLQSTPPRGEHAVSRVLTALTAKRDQWKRTVLFLTWDENGGFFDHVVPPMPPSGTPGEFITVDPLGGNAGGIRGPIGLGPRVPLLVISPFSRGGYVSSDVFDHTSLLRFLETRFGAEVPNLSQWRRDTCDDLTRALNFAAVDPSLPRLPAVAPTDMQVGCSGELRTYPQTSGVPRQARGRARRPSGPVHQRRRG